MSEFDPYLKWLGIRDNTRPVNHYRLLGLDVFESDRDVISMAADRQMAHVRTYQSGPHGEQSQHLLNELARARRCLLTEQKEAYDQQLRQTLAAASTSVGTVTGAHEPEQVDVTSVAKPGASSVSIAADPNARAKVKVREKKEMLWSIIGWISGGVAAVGVSAYLLASGILPNGRGEVAKEDGESVIQPELGEKSPVKNPLVTAPVNVPSEIIGSNSQLVDNQNETNTGDPNSSSPVSDPDPDVSSGNDSDDDAETDVVVNSGRGNPILKPIDLPDDAVVISTGLMMPESTRWTLGNSGDYPFDAEELKSAIVKVAESISKNQYKPGNSSNDISGHTFYEDIPEEPGVLIGFRIWLNKLSYVSALQPIYLRPSGVAAGLALGKQTPNVADVIAEPGYVVSAIRVSPLAPMRSIKLEFGKQTTEGIDSDDGYSSDCYGVEMGPTIDLTSESLDGYLIGVKVGTQRFRDLGNRMYVSSLAVVSTGIGKMKIDPFSPDAPGPSVGSSAAGDRTPIPSQLDQTKAAAHLAKLFKGELDAIASMAQSGSSRRSSVREIRRLHDTLIDHAESASDPLERYVTLGLARQISASSGDAARAIGALSILNDEFEIDYWSQVNATLNVAAANIMPNQQIEFKQTVDQLIVDAVELRNFEVAEELIASAIKIAGSNGPLRNWYRQQRDEVRELSGLLESYEKSKAEAESKPEDVRANKTVGEYLFLLEPRSDSMISYWEKSGYSPMEKVAELEASVDRKSGESMRELAEAWHRLGRGKHSLVRYRALRRALATYRIAERLLEGTARDKVNSLIQELDAELVASPSNIEAMLEKTSSR